jgi:hypothetical protein
MQNSSPTRRGRRRPTRLGIVLTAVAATMATVPAGVPAQAATRQLASGYQDCPKGFVCAWFDRNFTGRRWQGEHDNWDMYPANKVASSVYNNGRRCDVWLWTEQSYTGHALYLYRGSRLAYLNQNPGPSPVGSWEDVIQSNHWCTPN